jgi:hypothetical protein
MPVADVKRLECEACSAVEHHAFGSDEYEKWRRMWRQDLGPESVSRNVVVTSCTHMLLCPKCLKRIAKILAGEPEPAPVTVHAKVVGQATLADVPVYQETQPPLTASAPAAPETMKSGRWVGDEWVLNDEEPPVTGPDDGSNLPPVRIEQ